MTKKITAEYIRGLTDGEGSFTFCTTNGKSKIPSFQLRMNVRDKALVEKVRDFLKIKNRVYVYHYLGKVGSNRGPQAMLIVREVGNLKNKIVPLFYNELIGYKAEQFNNWIEKIGNDPMVPERFKIIHFLHKRGYFLKNKDFLERHFLTNNK